jgi:hypothetical protein
MAEDLLLALVEKLCGKYPLAIESWQNLNISPEFLKLHSYNPLDKEKFNLVRIKKDKI